MLAVASSSLRIFTFRKGLSTCVRTLYGSARLGVDSYVQKREKLALQMANSKEEFYSRMTGFAEGREALVTAGDLNQMLHLAIADEQDQSLLQRMLTRYHSESSGLRFNKFVFGPVVMRMYWHLGLADRALQAFNDPALTGFFDQLSSFVLLQDLLYRQGRYQEVLDTMEQVMQRQVQGARHPIDCIVLTLAACYQMNSAASYEYSRSLLARLHAVGHVVSRRAVSLAAALALRRGEPQEALAMLQPRTDTDRAIPRDLLAMSLAELGRPSPAVDTLQGPLLLDLPQHVREATSVTQDAMDSVEAAVQKKSDAEITSKWKKVKQGLESYGLVKGLSLQEVLTKEITYRRNMGQNRRPNELGASFNRGRRPERPALRPGLKDMVD
ncbi:pentatricopeptide repeat-containing protein 2, mitochondrial-like [Amphibalanus amphitrite]|uniref:pentatricopeptide repeat-containing protein 2, mitochondrial-like n=1 Tax=Amphibalanus amphitrite TaxID=1232801 RepID=UPI001C907E95|nr:pentatricopeptide repeat-containing protein 2, mitochondrial-like [Amphibalanus amphitrite]